MAKSKLLFKSIVSWGPAKKNSTRKYWRGSRKGSYTKEYRDWEANARYIFMIDHLASNNGIAFPETGPVSIEIKAFPPSNRPDVHNQIDGIMDALQTKKPTGKIIDYNWIEAAGAIMNDRQVVEVQILKVAVDKIKPRCEVYVYAAQ